MALVKFGGGIIQMSGSIAGNTFARNRYGNYVRARTKPINPISTAQQAVRTAIGQLTARWGQTLSAAQRTAWGLYASSVAMKNKLGEVVYLSGFNHYIRSNAWLKRVGAPSVDDGPVIFELPEKDATFAITASEATQQITYAYNAALDWASETGGYLQLFQGSPQNPQRNFFAGPWRSNSMVTGVDAAPPASPKIQAVEFAIAEGQHQWAYARIVRADGRLSEPFRADTFCAA